jgi:hypothetical protein
MSTSNEGIAAFFKRYGPMAVVTHIFLSLGFYGLSYLLVSRGVDMKKVLQKLRINANNKWSATASNGGVAYIVYKVTMPLRIPVTIAVVTFLGHYWQKGSN